MESEIGKTLEIGSKFLVTDQLLTQLDNTLLERIKTMITLALVRKCMDEYLFPIQVELEKERDDELSAWKVIELVDTKFQPSLTLAVINLNQEAMRLQSELYTLKQLPIHKYIWRKLRRKL